MPKVSRVPFSSIVVAWETHEDREQRQAFIREQRRRADVLLGVVPPASWGTSARQSLLRAYAVWCVVHHGGRGLYGFKAALTTPQRQHREGEVAHQWATFFSGVVLEVSRYMLVTLGAVQPEDLPYGELDRLSEEELRAKPDVVYCGPVVLFDRDAPREEATRVHGELMKVIARHETEPEHVALAALQEKLFQDDRTLRTVSDLFGWKIHNLPADLSDALDKKARSRLPVELQERIAVAEKTGHTLLFERGDLLLILGANPYELEELTRGVKARLDVLERKLRTEAAARLPARLRVAPSERETRTGSPRRGMNKNKGKVTWRLSQALLAAGAAALRDGRVFPPDAQPAEILHTLGAHFVIPEKSLNALRNRIGTAISGSRTVRGDVEEAKRLIREAVGYGNARPT